MDLIALADLDCSCPQSDLDSDDLQRKGKVRFASQDDVHFVPCRDAMLVMALKSIEVDIWQTSAALVGRAKDTARDVSMLIQEQIKAPPESTKTGVKGSEAGEAS